MIRVLIVCDRAVVRGGLRCVLETPPDPPAAVGAPPANGSDGAGRDLVIAGEAATLAEATALLASSPPTVVLVDLAMPLREGLQATAELCRQAGPSRVLVLGGYAGGQQAPRALEAGASGFLRKGAEVAELRDAIRSLARGQTYVSPDTDGVDEAAAARDPATAALSRRELEVMCFLASGMTNREIAGRLGISVKTIDTHRGHVLKKLALRNNSDITRFAIRHGLVEL